MGLHHRPQEVLSVSPCCRHAFSEQQCCTEMFCVLRATHQRGNEPRPTCRASQNSEQKETIGRMIWYPFMDLSSVASDSCCGGLHDDNGDSLPSFSEQPAALFIVAAVTGLISLAGLVAPSLRNVLSNTSKDNFVSLQAVAVVRKVFLLRHDTYISTPTSELPRLLMKLFQLDRIFTYLYITSAACVFRHRSVGVF